VRGHLLHAFLAFLRPTAYAKRVSAIVRSSVRPSVRHTTDQDIVTKTSFCDNISCCRVTAFLSNGGSKERYPLKIVILPVSILSA